MAEFRANHGNAINSEVYDRRECLFVDRVFTL